MSSGVRNNSYGFRACGICFAVGFYFEFDYDTRKQNVRWGELDAEYQRHCATILNIAQLYLTIRADMPTQ
jgi:hypothetical protein